MVSAFTSLCNVLCNSVSLHVPTSCDSFVLECDACATGIGSVLSIQRDGVLLPVGFFSRQLRGAQSRYSAQELEGLALYESVMHFAYYLYGSVFRVVTDHKGLTNFCSGRQCNRRIYRWPLKLAEFQFTVEYRKGAENGVADCLSRCFGADEDEKDLEETSSSEVVTHLSKRGGDVGVEPHHHIFKN